MTQKAGERLNLVSIMDDSTGRRQHGKLRPASESRGLSARSGRQFSTFSREMSLGLTEHRKEDREQRLAEIRDALGSRTLVLVVLTGARKRTRDSVLMGLRGAGKPAVGRRLAAWLDLPFIDADAEIEAAAGATISEIFAEHGEGYFRQGERRVIA